MARLDEVKRHARRLFAQGEAAYSLRLCDAIVAATPHDFESRIKVADCLAALGLPERAAAVYRAVGWYALKAGRPLAAIVIARVLETLDVESDDLMAALVVQYGSESELIGKMGARLSLPGPDTELLAPNLEDPAPDGFVEAAAHRAEHCLDEFDDYPASVHGIPLLSDLSESSLRKVLSTFVVRRLPDGSAVIKQGEPGQSFFFVASGQLIVSVSTPAGDKKLAELSEGALFGEMALLSAQPRSASVHVAGEADLLEVTRESLATLSGELEQIAVALHAFTRDRLLRNLMTTHPLFRPFSTVQRRDLLRRFTSHDVGPGTEIIHEGDEGRGLFVVLAGEVDVRTGQTPLATLRAGDVFGEIALIRGGETSAQVTATAPSTVLFLARENVSRIVAGVPEIRQYLESLAEDRELDTKIALSGDLGDDDVVILI